MPNLTIATVNVAGLKGAVYDGKAAKQRAGLGEWFKSQCIDVLCLQETKISEKNKAVLDRIFDVLKIKCDNFYLQEDNNNPGHGGVAVWINPATCECETDMYVPEQNPFEHTEESKKYNFSGRWLEMTIKLKSANQKILLVNSYFHSAKSKTYKDSKGKLIDPKRAEETMRDKQYFFAKTTQRMRILMGKNPNFILVGDINTAHNEIDIKNAKGNIKSAGFLPEERAWLDLWFSQTGDNKSKKAMEVYKENINARFTITPPPKTDQFEIGALGLHDVYRENPGLEEYSMWSWRVRQFNENAGRRIDYQIASESMAKSVVKAEIQKKESYKKLDDDTILRWSDHAPVVVTYDIE